MAVIGVTQGPPPACMSTRPFRGSTPSGSLPPGPVRSGGGHTG
jgi:hypothetical protein